MAGRIRSIKPEILEDEKSAGLSSDAWRLWVSMWLLADDHGRLRGSQEWLKAQVFWATPHHVAVGDLLIELASAGVIVRYEIAGQKYIEIPNWSKHQKVDHPGKPRIPGPSDVFRETLASPSETLAPDLRSPTRTSDQDHRPLSLSAPESPTARKALAGKPSKPTRAMVDRWRNEAESILDALNAARKRVNPGSRGISPTYDSLSHIAARLEAGKSTEDCLHVIEVCESESHADAGSFKWFDAITPFRPENFERKCAADPRFKGERNYSHFAKPMAHAAETREEKI